MLGRSVRLQPRTYLPYTEASARETLTACAEWAVTTVTCLMSAWVWRVIQNFHRRRPSSMLGLQSRHIRGRILLVRRRTHVKFRLLAWHGPCRRESAL